MIDNLKVWQLLSTNRWNDQHWRHLHWLPGTNPHELGNQPPKWPEHLHGVYWQHAYVLVYSQHIFLGFFSSGVGRALSQSLAGAMVNSVFDWCYLLSRILKDDQEFDWGTDPRTQRRRCATQWWPRSSPLCETSGTSPLSSVPGVSAMWRLSGEGWGICGGPARTSPTPGTAYSGTLMSTMRWDISKLPVSYLTKTISRSDTGRREFKDQKMDGITLMGSSLAKSPL